MRKSVGLWTVWSIAIVFSLALGMTWGSGRAWASSAVSEEAPLADAQEDAEPGASEEPVSATPTAEAGPSLGEESLSPQAQEDGATSDAITSQASAKPTWSGPSRMPLGSATIYDVTDGSIEVKSGDAIQASYNTVYAIQEGTATLALLDTAGNECATKTITVYPIEGKTYELQSAANASYVLDIKGASQKNSAPLICYRRNGGSNQRFQFEAKDTAMHTYYAIKCAHSGKYIDVRHASTKASQPVIQYAYNGNQNQLWYLMVDAQNRVEFISVNSDMCLDIQGAKIANSTKVIQYPVNDADNQLFVLNEK